MRTGVPGVPYAAASAYVLTSTRGSCVPVALVCVAVSTTRPGADACVHASRAWVAIYSIAERARASDFPVEFRPALTRTDTADSKKG